MIRYHNGCVLTMDGDCVLRECEVWTSGDKISYVGPARADAPEFEREIDLRGGILMPGFKNAHAHTAMTFVRSYADGLPLQDWLFGKIIPLEGKLTPEHIYWFTLLGIMEYLTSGITAAFDMYYFRESIARAGMDAGFRTVLCGGGAERQVIFDECERYNSISPLVSYLPGLHAEYTSSPADIEAAQELVRAVKKPFFAHNSETAREVAECRERRGGMTPTEFFDSLGLFDYGGGGFHCVHFSENDIEIFKKRGLYAVTCPGSNAKLASGIAPLTDFLRAGVPLAVGTDGASSNNALDMFREMYLGCVLQKLRTGDAAACPAEDMLRAACCGGAMALGLDDCRCIAPGMQADMVVIDMDRPSMRPVIDPAKNLVYSGSKENVKLTMVAGKILYENGEFFIGAEPGKIYETANRMIAALTE